MLKKLGEIILTVRNYDEALDFYVNKLGFKKVSDAKIGPGMRWVSVAPSENNETVIVFEQATTAADKARLGKQFTGMMLNIMTDDMDETYRTLKANGVEFVEEPSSAPWGKQAVIKDLYGNVFDLLEPRQRA